MNQMTSAPVPPDFEALARRGAAVAEEKKASDILMLDMHEMPPLCDFFVLASVKTRLQARAVANAIDEALDAYGVPRRRQGYRSGTWILLDYGGVVFHVFLDREREYYNLEGLWKDAPVVLRCGEPAEP